MNAYCTYVLASEPYGTLYSGVTNGLVRRIEEHRVGTASKDLYPSLPGVQPIKTV